MVRTQRQPRHREELDGEKRKIRGVHSREGIFRALEKMRSVTQAAVLLDVTRPWLSRWLNRPAQRARWRAMHKAWKQERSRLKKAEYRKRARSRYLDEKIPEILAIEKPLEMLHPLQIKILLEGGIISREKALELAKRRDYWQLKDPYRGMY